MMPGYLASPELGVFCLFFGFEGFWVLGSAFGVVRFSMGWGCSGFVECKGLGGVRNRLSVLEPKP